MTAGPKRPRHAKVSSSSLVLHPSNSSVNNLAKVDRSPADIYPLFQQARQRKYGPPSDWNEEPPRGSEVHVSKLPRDMLEDELFALFEKVGKIFDIRLMMESLETNKGFAFVKFCLKEDSEKAIGQLDNYEIRPNIRISVRKSIDNNRLFMGNIPKNYSPEDVLNSMREASTGVEKVILYASINDRTRNRGYGFVQFETHQQAKSTRSKLKLSPLVWSGQEIKVDWAEPEFEVDEEIMKKVKILYVRNLSLTTTDEQLRDLFSSFGGEIERVKKIKDYAFIHFLTREQAEEAKNNLQGYVLDKCELDINWSKPVTNREEYHQRKAAAKALSSTISPANAMHAAFGLNGEPIIINPKVRTAAGAQGYNASRPYPLRPKPNENPISNHPSQLLYGGFDFLQNLSVKTAIDSYGLQTTALPQTVYATERDDLIASQQDIQCQLAQPQLIYRYPNMYSAVPYSFVSQSAVNNYWGAQTFIQPPSTSPTFLSPSPYVLSAPSIAAVQGAYPFYGSQMLTQISSVSGSNMSIDRT